LNISPQEKALMTMVSFFDGGVRFNYRAAGIVLHEGRVLLTRFSKLSFWFLPGGRVDLGESSPDALRREMREEIREDVTIERLVWVVENFYKDVEGDYHELGMYYLMTLPEGSPVLRADGPVDFLDAGQTMQFQWFPLAGLDQIEVMPPFVVNRLRDLPDHPVHILERR
jgi:8-oxo-dGTP pyrophosphatase MutT (NUDIX family)